MKVIDISYAQTNVKWAELKVDGVIIRCGFRAYANGRCYEDSMFSRHITNAKKTDLKLGVYFFSQAITEEEGREEAEYVLDLLKTYKVEPYFPIAIDTEYISPEKGKPTPRANNISKERRTRVIRAFCDRIKAHGCEPMIYASTSWLNNQLDMKELPFKVWVADYRGKCYYKGAYIMWQYTDKGKVNGIPGDVDISNCYIKEKKMTAIKWKGNLTEHFSSEEYVVGNAPTATLSIDKRVIDFADCLEEFRLWLKRPMTVTSWKRSKALNQKVGGISTSNHLTGTACDWHTNIKIDADRFVKYAKKWKKICKAHGFVGEAGLYAWGVHFGIQSEAQIKANGGKFFNWDSRTGKQKNNAFKI